MVPRGAGTPSEEPTRTAGRGREQPRQDRVWPTRRGHPQPSPFPAPLWETQAAKESVNELKVLERHVCGRGARGGGVELK